MNDVLMKTCLRMSLWVGAANMPALKILRNVTLALHDGDIRCHLERLCRFTGGFIVRLDVIVWYSKVCTCAHAHFNTSSYASPSSYVKQLQNFTFWKNLFP